MTFSLCSTSACFLLAPIQQPAVTCAQVLAKSTCMTTTAPPLWHLPSAATCRRALSSTFRLKARGQQGLQLASCSLNWDNSCPQLHDTSWQKHHMVAPSQANVPHRSQVRGMPAYHLLPPVPAHSGAHQMAGKRGLCRQPVQVLRHHPGRSVQGEFRVPHTLLYPKAVQLEPPALNALSL